MDYIEYMIITRDQLIGWNGLLKLRFLLCFVLALLLAQTFASITWKVVGGVYPDQATFGKGKHRVATTLPAISIKNSMNSRLPVLAEELPLFGKAEKINRSLPAVAGVSAAPETTLALILKGVITAEPRGRALAIIAEKGKEDEEKLYGIGEKIPGNAVVSEIFAGRIILRRGGVLETLIIQNEENGASVENIRDTRAANSAIVNLGDGVHWQIDNSYLEQRLGDIPSLAKEVGVEVYKENNAQTGYRLVSARGSKLLRDMGLQPGDILHEVNGVKLDTIHAGLSVYQQMRSVKELRVVISRNGRRETRIYEVGNGG